MVGFKSELTEFQEYNLRTLMKKAGTVSVLSSIKNILRQEVMVYRAAGNDQETLKCGALAEWLNNIIPERH